MGYAMAIIDQDRAYHPNNSSTITSVSTAVHPKQTPSMSHVVNARTNPQWSHKNSGKIIQGRKRWFSIPLTLVISNNYDSVVELSNRLMEVNVPTLSTINNTSDDIVKFSTTINSNRENSTVILINGNNTKSNVDTKWKKPKPIIRVSTVTITLIVCLFVIILFHFRWKLINNLTTWNRKRRERMFYQH